MRTTHLTYDVEIQLRKDFHAVHKRIEEILIGGKANHEVISPRYVTPQVNMAAELPRSDDRGELHHYRRVRNVVEYIFEHDGMIREKYRELLQQIHAPKYIMDLIGEKVA